MSRKSTAAKGSQAASKAGSAGKSVVRKARPTKRQVKQVGAINKKATQYTQNLLKKGAKALEQGVGKIEQGAEKLGNVLLKPFRS